ncbi:MAG: sirohydrochlorin chelatase [Clostridia bacterium]
MAHGAKDPEWSRPFEQIALALKKKLPAVAIGMAYLEHGASLPEAVAVLAAKGALAIRVVPVFLGQGGHVKVDLPRLVGEAQSAYPGIHLQLEAAIGERAAVIEAIAEVIADPRASR